MRSFMRCTLVVPALLSASALLACSSVDTAQGADGGAQESVAAKGEPLDTSAATRIFVGQGYCGGAPGHCYGQRGFTITFAGSLLERDACVEGDGGSAATSRALTADELRRVRDGLAGLRFTSDPHTSQDGQMFGLTVTTPSGVESYSPEAACNQANFKKIVAGWGALWDTVSLL
jgi:hypothetical protein